MTVRSISAGLIPTKLNSVSSHTAYSSEVRCGSVAMRQLPRQRSLSCTAKTTLVLPASTTSSIARYPNNSFAAVCAAPTSGAGTRKKNVVTSAPTPPTKVSEAVLGSNAGSAWSKYMTLMTLR